MASNASSASLQTTSTDMPEHRRPAGPLPSKHGEIGFVEGTHTQQSREVDLGTNAPLPPFHPADRDAANAISTPSSNSPPVSEETSSSSTTAPSVLSTRKLGISRLWDPEKAPVYFGCRLPTLLRLFLHLACIGSTIAAWIVTVNHVMGSGNPSVGDQNTQAFLGPGMANLFIYVAFGVATLAQLLFLERVIFRLRAERYCFLHPGEVLPTSTRGLGYRATPGMGFAPWNRPPLPTYAAALAQSGYGTGDVEDNVIAIAPPPEYGNTRGSTLVLANLLRNVSQRSQRDRESRTASHMEMRNSRMSEMSGRPMSYVSRDEEWEERRTDAERARRLEETLAKLEEGNLSETQRS